MTVNELLLILQSDYKGDETLFVQWIDADHVGLTEKKWAKVAEKLEYLHDEISTLVFDAVAENK
jgi:hypothetical protein